MAAGRPARPGELRLQLPLGARRLPAARVARVGPARPSRWVPGASAANASPILRSPECRNRRFRPLPRGCPSSRHPRCGQPGELAPQSSDLAAGPAWSGPPWPWRRGGCMLPGRSETQQLALPGRRGRWGAVTCSSWNRENSDEVPEEGCEQSCPGELPGLRSALHGRRRRCDTRRPQAGGSEAWQRRSPPPPNRVPAKPAAGKKVNGKQLLAESKKAVAGNPQGREGFGQASSTRRTRSRRRSSPGLKELQASLADSEKKLKAKDKKLFASLSKGSTALAKVKTAWPRVGVKNAKVDGYLGKLDNSYTALRSRYGAEGRGRSRVARSRRRRRRISRRSRRPRPSSPRSSGRCRPRRRRRATRAPKRSSPV